MKSVDYAPFTEARNALRQKLDQTRETGRPVVVTTHKRIDGYILSPERYEQLVEAERLLENLMMIDRSVGQLERGAGRPMGEALRNMIDHLQSDNRR